MRRHKEGLGTLPGNDPTNRPRHGTSWFTSGVPLCSFNQFVTVCSSGWYAVTTGNKWDIVVLCIDARISYLHAECGINKCRCSLHNVGGGGQGRRCDFDRLSGICGVKLYGDCVVSMMKLVVLEWWMLKGF